MNHSRSDSGVLPPAVSLIIEGGLWKAGSADELQTELKRSGLLRELRRQATWTVCHHKYFAPTPGEFLVTPSDSLNPFAPNFKCGQFECLMRSTDQFVKTVALYVDQVVVPDPFTAILIKEKVDIQALYSAIAVYRHLRPLVDSGAVVFAPPVNHLCPDCERKATRAAETAATRIVDEALRGEIEITRVEDRFVDIESAVLYSDPQHPLILRYPLPSSLRARLKGQPSEDKDRTVAEWGMNLFRDVVSHVASQSLFILSMAQDIDATFLTCTRTELLCFTELDGVRPAFDNLEEWESLHTIDLPWIRDLSVDECLVLRQEAHTALPRLRSMLRGKQNLGCTPADVLADLRAQVAEVEAEVLAIQQLGDSKFRMGVEGLGLAMVFYGMASGNTGTSMAGLAGLLTALGHAQTTARAAAERQLKVASSPAFALMKAKHLLRQRTLLEEH